jgi:hypothetical protein
MIVRSSGLAETMSRFPSGTRFWYCLFPVVGPEYITLGVDKTAFS